MTRHLAFAAVLSCLSTPSGVAQEVVASVSIVIPERGTSDLRTYVPIQPGDPLDPLQIRRAVELLYATGDFEDVVVESTRGERGADLVFRPAFSPRLREVRVEGGSPFGAGTLRHVARLRAGEPLWPPRLEAAAQAAGIALAADGFLESQVTASALRSGREADAIFRVAAGPRARVGHVQFEGSLLQAAGAGLEAFAPHPGDVFRRAEARRAAERMRQRLAKQGLWRAHVDLREAYSPSGSRMDLVYQVDAGDRTEVEFHGSPLPGSLRRSILALLRDGGFGSDVLDEANDRIEEFLRTDGYRDAFVSRREEAKDGVQTLVYVTEPGPQARVALVRFSGFEDPRLEAVVETRALSPIVDRVVSEDLRRLVRFLADQGYSEGHVESEIPDGGGDLPVRFVIRPGARTILRSVEVDIPVDAAGPAAAKKLRTKAGEPYRARDVAADRDALVTAYGNEGYLQATVTPDVSLSEEKDVASVVFHVIPGARTEVDHVIIARLGLTRPEVVKRELTFKEGSPLGLSQVLESQRRLSALGIFDRVSITEMDSAAAGPRTLVVAAEEAPRTTIAYGIGYAEKDLLRGSVEVSRRNLFGMDRSLTAFARGSFRGNRLLTTFREPYLFGRKLELFVTGFREEEERDGFSFIRYGGLLQTALRIGEHRGLILRLSYQKTDLFDVTVPVDEIDRQFQNSTSAGPSGSLIEDTRDDPLDPHRGHFFGADLQLSDSVFGGDNFVKTFVQLAAYRRLLPRLLLAVSGRLGLAATLREGDPERLPLPDRFFAGGDNSLRGFPLDTVGPQEVSTSGALVPTGGNALLLGNAEFRIDAARRVSVAIFSDSGNVYPVVSAMSLGDVRYTAGLGLRYKTALGPIRVDWGYKLNRRAGESPGHFHFTIGNAF
jgi:outer membrane protein insertion porin family